MLWREEEEAGAQSRMFICYMFHKQFTIGLLILLDCLALFPPLLLGLFTYYFSNLCHVNKHQAIRSAALCSICTFAVSLD